MNRLFSHIHTLVKREGAEQYLLYSLLSFAASVSLTRLFLEVTGYPQLGNSQLHIAHVLWGGLLLFVAALLPLIAANRWVYTTGGILSGTGVGLFIDEVGKFITQSNDYFYPAAAPIIYAFFLLVVLFYLRVRRPASDDPRAELYRAFDGLQEVLEHDLDPHERADLIARLDHVVRNAEHPNHVALARALLDFIEAESLEVVPPRPSLEDRLQHWFNILLDRYLHRWLLKSVLMLSLSLTGLVAMADLLVLLPGSPGVDDAYLLLAGNADEPSANLLFLSLTRLALEGGVGLMLLAGAVLLLLHKEQKGITMAYFGLLIALTILNLLRFYFDQFSTIVLAMAQFAMLMGLLTYRQRYLAPTVEEVAQSIHAEH